jgi:hypothetical protein
MLLFNLLAFSIFRDSVAMNNVIFIFEEVIVKAFQSHDGQTDGAEVYTVFQKRMLA